MTKRRIEEFFSDGSNFLPGPKPTKPARCRGHASPQVSLI
jgi:hypothetical protein